MNGKFYTSPNMKIFIFTDEVIRTSGDVFSTNETVGIDTYSWFEGGNNNG